MENIKIYLLLLMVMTMAISCGSTPQTPPVVTEETLTENTVQETEDVFDINQLSESFRQTTREDVQQFIKKLNDVITKKDFNSWKMALSTEYFNEISSPENLARVSDMLKRNGSKTEIKTAQDYFLNVVVPARSASRVNYLDIDIEFLSRNQVKAFVVVTKKDGTTDWNTLYELEQTDNMWKIIK
jgi:hypothetical protein